MFKKSFKTGHVYAGPEPMKHRQKEEFEMRDVYNGPEQMGVPKENQVQPKTEPAAIPETETEMKPEIEVKRARPVPPRPVPRDADVRAIYAAPDVMQRMRVLDSQENNPFACQNYPFNQMTGVDGGIGKGMAVPGSQGDPNGAEVETIVCPECGEKTRCGKFCEYCGKNLK